jgi:hypothetical protein
MPATLSPKAGRFTVDLPEVTRRQMLELMGENQESARDCVMIAIAERHQRECGEPERDLIQDVDRILKHLGLE